jgi:hypothetical protein
MSDDERIPVTLFGRNLGTATGWDGDDLSIQFYNFIPAEGISAQTLFTDAHGTLALDIENGLIIAYDDNGNVAEQDDLIKRIKDLPRIEA